MKPVYLTTSILLYTCLSAAWPWPPTFPISNRGLERRQDDDGPRSTTRGNQPSRTSTAKATASETGSSADASETGKASGTAEASETGKASGTAEASETGKASGTAEASETGKDGTKTTKGPKPTNIDVNDPPGGIQMLTPAQTSTTYFKIGDDVTLVWNYTSLQATPSHVDVIATNTAGTWTIAANQSVEETASVVWKTDQYKNEPLPMDKYTLVVYDTKEGPTALPEPGHLSPYVQYQFAMYLPRDRIDGAPFCATCSGAMSEMERQTLKFVFGMAAVTVLSFTWFAGSFFSAF